MQSLFLLAVLASTNLCFSQIRVTIDPGHGGEDKGAVHGKVEESQVALQISKKLFERLRKDSQFQVQILRTNNRALSLEQRVLASQKFRSDIFLSIHANAHPDRRARGAEFYIENQLAMKQENLRLAHNELSSHVSLTAPRVSGDVGSILADLEKTSRIASSYQLSSHLRKQWSKKKKKMIRQGPFYVLNQSPVPAVLVEVGYLSNKSERLRLIQKKEQKSIAKKIHDALKGFAKNVDKLPPGILEPQNAKTR